MNYVALLGAGFSKNWGGWLASEAFEYLLGCPTVDSDIKGLLWKHWRQGGFESALGELQSEYTQRRDPTTEERLAKLQGAVGQMFDDMNSAFAAVEFGGREQTKPHTVGTFLAKFDAIFTLNQDLLLEYHYVNNVVANGPPGKWTGFEMPGMRAVMGSSENVATGKWVPKQSPDFLVHESLQPYFKLHGSSNWFVESGGRPLLIMGGNKFSSIEQHPILQWTHEQFSTHLSLPETRLMIIGYSFGDDHINRVIRKAAEEGTVQLFVIDPNGVKVIDENRTAAIWAPGPLFEALHPRIIGASQRRMHEIFGRDLVEHAKVMRFFS